MIFKTARSGGFWLSLVLNMAFRCGWAGVALLLLLLHFILGWPLYLVWACLGLWVLHAFIVTAVLSALTAGNGKSDVTPANKNPYSRRDSDF